MNKKIDPATGIVIFAVFTLPLLAALAIVILSGLFGLDLSIIVRFGGG